MVLMVLPKNIFQTKILSKREYFIFSNGGPRGGAASKRAVSQPDWSEAKGVVRIPLYKQKYSRKESISYFQMVGREGFEPPKVEPVDLQSTPFDRSGIDPMEPPIGFEPMTYGLQDRRSTS